MTRTRTRVAATAAALVVVIPLLSACDDVTRGPGYDDYDSVTCRTTTVHKAAFAPAKSARSGSSRRGTRRTTVPRPRRTETRSTCTGSAW